MSCLRCGRETGQNRVFCDVCQQNMDQYPVKPGTAIHLPHANTPAPAKKKSRRKRPVTPEEQVLLLRKALRQARILLVATVLVLCVAVGMLIYQLFHLDDPIIGRNYTIDTTQQTD